MKTLRALRDPLTAGGEEVLIERVDLRRANNILRKHGCVLPRDSRRGLGILRHRSAGIPLNRIEQTLARDLSCSGISTEIPPP